MSSGEEDFDEVAGGSASKDNEDEGPYKKRRIQRACDICRRKKIRCDGPQMPNNRCSNCLAYHHECTYVEAAKKRGPPKGYVEGLEHRLEKMEQLLHRALPGQDFTQELGPPLRRENFAPGKTSAADRNTTLMSIMNPHSPTSNLRTGISLPMNTDPVKDEELYSSDDEIIQGPLTQQLKRMELSDNHQRFHGKSSGFMLIAAARDLKREYTGNTVLPDLQQPMDSMLRNRRPEFWTPYPWEIKTWQSLQWNGEIEYPPEDLMHSLIDMFFRHMNPFLPLLHRPTFERKLKERVQDTDISFAAVVMLILAIGSRWSDDPRVLLDPNSKYRHSAGWKYYDQIKYFRKSLMARPTLHDMQLFVLSCVFLQGSSAPHSCWTVVGIGIRFAQDVGAHRRKAYRGNDPEDDESWKRAFWCLVAMDRMVSSALGLPCAIHDEDFDVDFPKEVDDEYWAANCEGKTFVQPENKPSQMSFFICYLRLMQILSFALRTIYSINKSKAVLGFVGARWEQHIVAELDSALNKWHDSVPPHLRWDPSQQHPIWFEQSAILYATYYQLQILIHRPFIPSPRRPNPLSFPSLAICSNAARTCSHICEQARRRGGPILPSMIVAAFTSGIVLLINVWGGKKAGLKTDPSSQLQDTHNCMQILKLAEDRWHSAGKLWDILCELASFGDLPLPQSSPPDFSHKRDRESDSPPERSSSAVSSQPHFDPMSRPIAKAPSRSTTGITSFSNSPASSFPPSVNHTPPEAFRPSPSSMSTLSTDAPSGFQPAIHSQFNPMKLNGTPQSDGSSYSPSPMDPQNMHTSWFSDPSGTPSQPSAPSSSFSSSYYSHDNTDFMSLLGGDPMSFFSEGSAIPYSLGDPRLPPVPMSANPVVPAPGADDQQAQFPIFGDVASMPQQLQFPGGQPGQQGASFSGGNIMPMWSGAPYGFAFDSWAPYLSNVNAIPTDPSDPASRPS